MNKPRQLPLPFARKPVQPRDPAGVPEMLMRLRRIESRLVQLMKHQGMTDDGRVTLGEDEAPTRKEN